MSEKRSVTVQILGHEYRVRSDGDDEAVQRVAQFLEEMIQKIRSRTTTIDTMDVVVLTALNLANELLALREGRGLPAPGLEIEPERIRDLADLVESATASSASH